MATDYRKELADCPPAHAVAISGKIYRGIHSPPITEDNFKSHNELGLRGADKLICEKWGLSVWRSLEAAENARSLHNYMRRWHIAAGELASTEGVVLPTGNPKNPDHHTLWLDEGVTCAAQFSVVLEPLEAK
jgi:hypothetical protein